MKRKKKDGRANNGGSQNKGLAEGHVLVAGQRELLDAVEAAAKRTGVSTREAWRRAARAWLDGVGNKV